MIIARTPKTKKTVPLMIQVGQKVTGTLRDKTRQLVRALAVSSGNFFCILMEKLQLRLETQKAKDTQENRDIVHHIEKELHACSRSRHKVMRMQAALRRRLGMHSMGLVEWQSGDQEAHAEEEGRTGGTTDPQSAPTAAGPASELPSTLNRV